MSTSRGEQIKTVIRVSSGNFLEMYDFFVFGYFAAEIGRTFFPSDNDLTVLLSSFATFAVGFLMRPLGALVLGAYIDKNGRRKGLILTLILMAVGTVTMASPLTRVGGRRWPCAGGGSWCGAREGRCRGRSSSRARSCTAWRRRRRPS